MIKTGRTQMKKNVLFVGIVMLLTFVGKSYGQSDCQSLSLPYFENFGTWVTNTDPSYLTNYCWYFYCPYSAGQAIIGGGDTQGEWSGDKVLTLHTHESDHTLLMLPSFDEQPGTLSFRLSVGGYGDTLENPYQMTVGYVIDEANPMSSFVAVDTAPTLYDETVLTTGQWTYFVLSFNVGNYPYPKRIALECSPTPFARLFYFDWFRVEPAFHQDTAIFNDTSCAGNDYSGYGFSIEGSELVSPGSHVFIREYYQWHYVLNLTILNSDTTHLYASFQRGERYRYNDTVLTESGEYRFLYSNCIGCDSLVILHLEYEKITLSCDPDGICIGDSTRIMASDFAEGFSQGFVWMAEPNDETLCYQQGRSTVTVHPDRTTTYFLTVGGDTLARITVFVSSPLMPCIDLDNNEIDINNPVVFLHDCTEGSQYSLWSFSDGTTEERSFVTKWFNLPLSDSVEVTLLTCGVGHSCCSDTTFKIGTIAYSIWFPNVFTPLLEENNKFKGSLSFEPISYELFVYNRNGNLVFQTDDVNVAWEGKVKDVMQPQGAYVYKYKVHAPNGRVYSGIGTVMLLR